MYDTLLFDFDGTLVPSLEIWLQSFQYALTQYARAIPEDRIVARFFYREFDDVAAEFGLPSGDELRAHVLQGLSDGLATVTLHPGVQSVLDWCQTQPLALGLVTSSPRPQVEQALQHLGLADTFRAVVTGSDITHFKPHPEPILRALEQLGKPPETALVIGDYLADILAGQAAGTDTALFLPPAHAKFYDFDALRALGPSFEFTQWPALHDFLQSRIVRAAAPEVSAVC